MMLRRVLFVTTTRPAGVPKEPPDLPETFRFTEATSNSTFVPCAAPPRAITATTTTTAVIRLGNLNGILTQSWYAQCRTFGRHHQSIMEPMFGHSEVANQGRIWRALRVTCTYYHFTGQ